jgi:hypothetical protein
MTRPNRRTRQLFALFRNAGIEDRDQRLTIVSDILYKHVTSTNDLDTIEINAVVDTLNYWQNQNELTQQCKTILEKNCDKQFAGGVQFVDARGNQLVQVQFTPGGRNYTYAWDGDEKLQVGDVVETPTNWRCTCADPECGKPKMAMVCALGSEYRGIVTLLTRRGDKYGRM